MNFGLMVTRLSQCFDVILVCEQCAKPYRCQAATVALAMAELAPRIENHACERKKHV